MTALRILPFILRERLACFLKTQAPGPIASPATTAPACQQRLGDACLPPPNPRARCSCGPGYGVTDSRQNIPTQPWARAPGSEPGTYTPASFWVCSGAAREPKAEPAPRPRIISRTHPAGSATPHHSRAAPSVLPQPPQACMRHLRADPVPGLSRGCFSFPPISPPSLPLPPPSLLPLICFSVT